MGRKQRFNADDIVEAAFSIVRREGWDGLSARTISNELNSSTRPIYSYLDSMKTLEEEVVKKALDVFNQYLSAETTGDKWLDQAIGYVKFAMNERMLFRCINDVKHIDLQRQNTPYLWESLRKDLIHYEPFQNLSEKQINQVRVMRWFFIHGIATLINNGWFDLEKFDSTTALEAMDAKLIDVIKMANHIINNGMQDNKILEKIKGEKNE